MNDDLSRPVATCTEDILIVHLQYSLEIVGTTTLRIIARNDSGELMRRSVFILVVTLM